MRIQKEMVGACLKVLPQHVPGEAKDNYETWV
jgi:hypothetical protein